MPTRTVGFDTLLTGYSVGERVWMQVVVTVKDFPDYKPWVKGLVSAGGTAAPIYTVFVMYKDIPSSIISLFGDKYKGLFSTGSSGKQQDAVQVEYMRHRFIHGELVFYKDKSGTWSKGQVHSCDDTEPHCVVCPGECPLHPMHLSAACVTRVQDGAKVQEDDTCDVQVGPATAPAATQEAIKSVITIGPDNSEGIEILPGKHSWTRRTWEKAKTLGVYRDPKEVKGRRNAFFEVKVG